MVRDIIHPYFQMEKSFPDPVTAMQLLQNKGQMPQDPKAQEELYKNLWGPLQDANERDGNVMRAGDMFNLESGMLTNDIPKLEAGGGKGQMRGIAHNLDLAAIHDPSVQPTLKAVLQARAYNRNLKDAWRLVGKDFLGNPLNAGEEMLKTKQEIARRLRARRAPVTFDENSAEWSPEWEMAMNKYAFAGQWAYQTLGDEKQRMQANDVMEEVRRAPFGKDQLDEAARALGYDPVAWRNSDTVSSVLDAMRYSNDENIRDFAFDEFMFSRPVGMGEAQRRRQYASTFGTNRLPAKQMEVYMKETGDVNSAIGNFAADVGDKLRVIKRVPVVGDTLYGMGEIVNKAGYIASKPFEAVLEAATAAYFVGIQAETGMSYDQYKSALGEAGGVEKLDLKHKFNWGAFADLSNYVDAWKEVEGRLPLTIAIESGYLRKDGKIPPWATGIGQMGDLFAITKLGATYGDPAARYGFKLGARGSFAAARAVQKYGGAYKIDFKAIHKALLIDTSSTKMYSLGGTFGKGKPVSNGDFIDAFNETHGVRKLQSGAHENANDVRWYLSDVGDAVSLDTVKAFKTGKGTGTNFLNDLTNAADSTGKTLRLTAQPLGTAAEKMPKPKLKEVYERHGFREVDPNTTNPALMDVMERAPQEPKPKTVAPGIEIHADGQMTIGPVEGAGVKVPTKLIEGADGTGKRLVHLERDEYEALSPERKLPTEPGSAKIPEGAVHADSHGELANGMADTIELNWDNFHDTEVTTYYDPSSDTMFVSRTKDPHGEVLNRIIKEHGDNPHVEPWVRQLVTVTPLDAAWSESGLPSVLVHGTREGRRLLDSSPPLPHIQRAIAKLSTSKAFQWDTEVTWTKPGREEAAIEISQMSQPAHALAKGNRSGKAIAGVLEDAVERVKGDGPNGQFNKYMDEHGRLSEEHALHEKSPVIDHGTPGEVVEMYSIGGGLVESIVRAAKGAVVKRTHPYAPAALLRTNAELIAAVPDPFAIKTLYGLAEDIPELNELVKQAAASTSMDEVGRILRKMETHGADIDGGAAAAHRAIRYGLANRGFGQLGWTRVFNTMTTYGRTHDMAQASENVNNVGKAIRMGASTKEGRRAALVQLQDLSRKVYEADKGMKQHYVDQMWDVFEENLGAEKLAAFKRYNRRIVRARGQKYLDDVLGRSYMPLFDKDGFPIEGSKVLPADLERTLDSVHQGNLRMWDETWAERNLELADRVDALEQAYYAQHYAKGIAPSVTPKRTAWKGNKRTVTKSDGQSYEETRAYNPKTRHYETTGRTTVKEHHTGVVTKQGLKGGRELNAARKELAQAKAVQEHLLKNPEIQSARIDVLKQARALGASEDDLRKLAHAVSDAADKAARRQIAAEAVSVLGKKRKLAPNEQASFDAAEKELSGMSSQQPFKMGQTRTHIVHRYDPRIAGWYMSGGIVREFMFADQLVFEPIMRLFKETVMASLGFPLRVNVGDELARLIPEGVASRWKTSRKTVNEVKADGTDFTPFDEQLRNNLAKDWDTGNETGEWDALTPSEPGYYEALANDVQSWGREPIVRRLIDSDNFGGKGNFPTDASQVKRFIKRIRDERNADGTLSRDAVDMRNFLDDTYRSIKGKGDGPGTYNTPAFNEWVDTWADRLKLFAEHQPLRDALTGRGGIGKKELAAWGSANREVLWPVNAPMRTSGLSIARGNPLYGLSAINPYHYQYKYMTSKLMAGIGNWTKKQLFNDRYHTIRRSMIERNAEAAKRGEALTSMDEIHRIAGEAAVKHANAAAYSSATTMFEDMSRNMIPFISAYRQFFIYWAGAIAKHPVSISLFKENYPEFLQDPFAFATGDTQFIIPAIPFWGPDPEDGKTGFWSQVKAQAPSSGFLPLLPVRAGISVFGGDPKDYANLPLVGEALAGNMAPFKRWGRLAYGLGLNATWPEEMNSLFGDPEKLEKAHANAIMYWTKYGKEGTGTDGINQENAPEWVQALWLLTGGKGGWGEEHLRPEALYNEFVKAFLPLPVGAVYSPKPQREMQSSYAEYGKALRARDELGMALVRASNPMFDKNLTYYDATDEEKVAMKKDPDNFEMLKWWTGSFNYDNAYVELAPVDWQKSFFDNGGERLSDKQRLAAYHNVVTDIYGGHYVQGKKRTGGVSYMGDIKLAQLQKNTANLMESRLSWAKGVAKQVSKSLNLDYDRLMWLYQHPGGRLPDGSRSSWGIWNQIIQSKKLNSDEYDLNFIDQTLQAEGDLRMTPYEVPQDDLQREYNLKQWMVDPKLGEQLVSQSPNAKYVKAGRKELRDNVLKATTAIATDAWFQITAEELTLIGKRKADPRINLVQEKLHQAYLDWHKYKPGTSEYKDAHNAYYATQRKLLGGLKGGELLIGGLDQRLEHVDHFTRPQLTSLGSGPGAELQVRRWKEYEKVRETEEKKKTPDIQAINKAYNNYMGNKHGDTLAEGRVLEQNRVKNWHIILTIAHSYRKKLLEGHSDYYDSQGNSAFTKDGEAYAKQLNTMIQLVSKENSAFAKDIKEYFGGSDTVGSKLIDWYRY